MVIAIKSDKAIRSDDIGKKLVEVLGLPKETKWLEIRLAAGEAITVKGQFYMNQVQLESFYGFIKDYKADITEGAK